MSVEGTVMGSKMHFQRARSDQNSQDIYNRPTANCFIDISPNSATLERLTRHLPGADYP